MNDGEPTDVMATDRNPAVENAAASGHFEVGTVRRMIGWGCRVIEGVGVLVMALALIPLTMKVK
jgi:hypothetical protein